MFAIFVFVAINCALLFWGTANDQGKHRDDLLNHDRKFGSWWLAKAYMDRDKCPEIMLFGNSQMGAFQFADAQYFRKTVDYTGNRDAAYLDLQLQKQTGSQVDAFLAAMPGALISDDFAICRALCGDGPYPKLFIIGISPRDLIDSAWSAAVATEPFQFFGHAARLEDCLDLYCPKFWQKTDWLIKQALQLPDWRATIEDLTLSAQAWLAPAAQSKAMRDIGQAPLFRQIQPGELVLRPDDHPVFKDNTDEYLTRYRDPFTKNFDKQLIFLTKLIEFGRQHKIQVMVVSLPLTPQNRALLPQQFWTLYRDRLRQLCCQSDAHWLDLSQSTAFGQHDYSDCVHLNGFGGMKLCREVAFGVTACKPVLEVLKTKSPNPIKISQK